MGFKSNAAAQKEQELIINSLFCIRNEQLSYAQTAATKTTKDTSHIIKTDLEI